MAAEPNPFVYEVFDLLHLDGRSLLDEPLEERRRLLASRPAHGPAGPAERAHRGRRDRVLRGGPDARPRGDHGQGPAIAVRAGQAHRSLAEGQDPARSRSSSSAAGRRARARAVDLGALLVGVYEDGELRYAGKVGAGFTADRRAELLAALGPLAAEASPFSPPVPRAGGPRRPMAQPAARRPRRVRRLDGRRPRPPGRLQGHRAREGPAQGHPRAPEGLAIL